MEQENIVLCGANSYEEKYFFNEQFAALPTAIKDELKIMCVLFVNQVGGHPASGIRTGRHAGIPGIQS